MTIDPSSSPVFPGFGRPVILGSSSESIGQWLARADSKLPAVFARATIEAEQGCFAALDALPSLPGGVLAARITLVSVIRQLVVNPVQ